MERNESELLETKKKNRKQKDKRTKKKNTDCNSSCQNKRSYPRWIGTFHPSGKEKKKLHKTAYTDPAGPQPIMDDRKNGLCIPTGGAEAVRGKRGWNGV